jgi:hypothetical protein
VAGGEKAPLVTRHSSLTTGLESASRHTDYNHLSIDIHGSLVAVRGYSP